MYRNYFLIFLSIISSTYVDAENVLLPNYPKKIVFSNDIMKSGSDRVDINGGYEKLYIDLAIQGGEVVKPGSLCEFYMMLQVALSEDVFSSIYQNVSEINQSARIKGREGLTGRLRDLSIFFINKWNLRESREKLGGALGQEDMDLFFGYVALSKEGCEK